MIEFDVVICGAGPAGCATALALLQSGVERILIIDRPKPQRFHIGESAAPDVVSKLRTLGVDINLKQRGHDLYHGNISYWAGEKHHNDFLHHGRGQAWHLNRERFDNDLKNLAQELGTQLFENTSIHKINHDGNHWILEINHEEKIQTIKTSYLVDASGRRAAIARQFAIERKQLDTLTAIAWKTPTVKNLKGLTLVESFAHGWWYASQLPTGEGIVSLMTDADLIRKYDWQAPTKLIEQWHATELVKHHIPPISPENIQTQTYPAHGGFLTQAAGPSWIAVGDALAAFDPLTSSGISNALGDAIAAAPVITAWLKNKNLKPAEDYAVRTNGGVQRYLKESKMFYGMEKRWQKEAFWLRRL